MLDWRSREEWIQLVRYYQAGLVNMGFGYGVFAALLLLGLPVYAAQALGYVLGVAFNYWTYSRYAFADQPGNKLRFAASYAANYLVSVVLLWAALMAFPNPFVAGLGVTVAASLVNYLVLKKLVFGTKTEV